MRIDPGEVEHHVYVNLYHVTKFLLCLSPTVTFFLHVHSLDTY